MDFWYRNYANHIPCVMPTIIKGLCKAFSCLLVFSPDFSSVFTSILFFLQVFTLKCLMYGPIDSWILVKSNVLWYVCVFNLYKWYCAINFVLFVTFFLCTMFLRASPVALYLASSSLQMCPPPFSYPFCQASANQKWHLDDHSGVHAPWICPGISQALHAGDDSWVIDFTQT